MTLPKDYQVHMLRIWRTSSGSGPNNSDLHVTVENTKTAVRVGFNDFESLVTYLQQEVETAAT